MHFRRLLAVGFFLLSFLAVGSCASSGPFRELYRDNSDQKEIREYVAFDSKPLRPQPEWKQIYLEVRACADSLGYLGPHEPYERIKWYWAREIWQLNKLVFRGFGCYGTYVRPRTIALSSWAYKQEAGIERTVRHELLHHVSSVPGHPRLLFATCVP